MDEDENVWSQVHEFVEKGFLKAFDFLSDCNEYLGGDSRPFQIWAGDEGAKGLAKCIVSPLPLATDVVHDIMDMLHKHPLGTDEQLELLVLDSVCAFMERTVDGVRQEVLRGQIEVLVVFPWAAQGSRNGPKLGQAWCHWQ